MHEKVCFYYALFIPKSQEHPCDLFSEFKNFIIKNVPKTHPLFFIMNPMIVFNFLKKMVWTRSGICTLCCLILIQPNPINGQKSTASGKRIHSRYACLGKKVNWRSGPSSDHDLLWCYESPDWPILLLKKYNNWYYVKDYTGELGWVKGSMLRFKTTLLITKDTHLYNKANKKSTAKALLKKGAIVRYIKHSSEQWLYVMEPKNHLYGWILSDISWPNPASTVLQTS